MAISPHRAPGMFDVARSAGVSHQTVSRVVNDHPNVKPETRARVLAVIEQLGYRRNTVARALATNRSCTIGVITNREALYGPTSILLSLEAAARDEGYFVSLVTLSDASTPAMSAALQHFQDQAVEGIIVIASTLIYVVIRLERQIRCWAETLASVNQHLRDQATAIREHAAVADTLMSQRIEAHETRIEAIEKRLPPIEPSS